jgi:acyl-CoA synthetase (AMP-forming)/AMP-acid ligase II
LSDGENEESRLTFAEVDLRARAIGAWLSYTAALGDRIVLLSPSGSEFVSSLFGCLYGGVVAVPAYPLDPARPHRTASRLLGIVKDARPVIALTTTPSLRLTDELMQTYPELRRIHWKTIEDISTGLASDWKCPAIHAETLAILQYTSGSTATPKGVMLGHQNVLENEQMIQEAHHYSDTHTFVAWIPLAHDWGLINNVLQPLYVGAASILMPTEAFLQKPARWLQAISRYPNVTSGGPSFAYELCVNKITNEDRDKLNLEN